MRRIIAVLLAFLLVMQVFVLVYKIQPARADTEKSSESPLSSNPQYGDSNTTENDQKTSEAQPTIVQRTMNESELQLLKTKTGIGEKGQNYNQILKDHGTGLAPPSEEEWKLIENGASVIDQISTTVQYSPSSWDNSAASWFPPVGNQGQEGSCVAWAVGYYTKTFQEAKEHYWNVKSGAMQSKIVSPSFIYNLINYGTDGGSYFYDAMALVCSVGASSLGTMPYNAGDYTSWPSQLAWKEAPLYRANASSISYLMLQGDAGLASLKTWLSSGNLAIVGVDAYKIVDPFWGWSRLDGNDMLTLDNYVNPSPNHAGTIVGYNDNFAYTEGGQTHYGAFKIANSWGVGVLPSPFSWEHICDGCYWISYEAMKQRISYCMIYGDLLDYTPQLVATFGISHNKRGECAITVGAGNVNNPIVTKRFDNYIHGGNVPFCRNDILLDVTEFKNILTKIIDQQYFLRVYDGGSITVGTVTKFCINHAQSADTPLYTVNNNFVVANLTLTKMIVPDEYPTIQNAISSAWPSDAVFVRTGTYYEHVVIDKAIELIGENKETTIIDGNSTGNVINITANLVKVSGFTIRNSGRIEKWYYGIYGSRGTTGNNISGNIIAYNGVGFYLDSSSSNSVSGNNITDNSDGIYLYSSSNNNISENNITNSVRGIYLIFSSNNSISGNNITNNYEDGIYLYSSSNNRIFHNNFVNNNTPVRILIFGYANIWDDGYPSGGNYWSSFTGSDLRSGTYQNETGSDGIIDTKYVIDANNTDRYPLKYPWENGRVIFADEFESGNLGAWSGMVLTSGETASVSNVTAHHGVYSGKFTADGGSGGEIACVYKDIQPSSELYARGYFYVSSSGIAKDTERFIFTNLRAGTVGLAWAGWRMTGGAVKWFLSVRDGTGYVDVFSATIPLIGCWYCVELHWKNDPVNGLAEMWVDGQLVCSFYGGNTSAYGNVNSVRMGLVSGWLFNSSSTIVYADCVQISTKLTGPEQPRVLSFNVSTNPFSPNGDGINDSTIMKASFSETVQYKLQVRNSSGYVVRTWTATDASLQIAWDGKNSSGTKVSDGTYDVLLTGTSLIGASFELNGNLGVTVDTKLPVVTGISVSPTSFNPQLGKTTRMNYTLSENCYVTIEVYNSTGALKRTLLNSVLQTSGAKSIVWDGRDNSNAIVPTGTYTIKTYAADKAGNKAKPYPITKTVTVDMQPPTVTGVSVTPSSFKPILGQTTTINYTLSESCYVTIKVYNSTGALKRTLLNSVLQTSGAKSIVWDGRDNSNAIVPLGTYTIKIYVTDKAGNKATSYPIIKTVTVT